MESVSYISVALLVTMFVLCIVISKLFEKKQIKKFKSLLLPGRNLVFYFCVNEEFDVGKKLYSYTIVETKKDYFQCIDDEDGRLYYYEYTSFGIYADKYEIYDNDMLVYENGFIAEEKYYQR